MKRYASVDFLRGIAIFIMILVHIINHTLDQKTLFQNIDTVPIINIAALFVIPFLGGLAGFFLLVSAISNMISMYRYLEKGYSVTSLVERQIIQGLLLLFFAGVVEGFTGFQGVIGIFFKNLNSYDPAIWQIALYRWNHFETIHTIAWCVLLNGIIQGIFSRQGRWKDHKRLMRNYIILAIIVIVVTQFVWDFVDWLLPGYPWINPGYQWTDIQNITKMELYNYQKIGTSPFLNILIAPFLAALASNIEPIFPYLAISFVGSIIGIGLCLPKEKLPKKFVPSLITTGVIAGIVGYLGIIITLGVTLDQWGFNAAIDLYLRIPWHREWVPENPALHAPFFSWFWVFLAVNGFSILGSMIIIYLVDFRGNDAAFARKTTFIRRFGFVAFTNYNNQWYYWLLWYILTLIFGLAPYTRLNWAQTWLLICITFLFYWGVNLLWEKIGYIGSLEWVVTTIGSLIRPGKKGERQTIHWWQRGQLNVKEGFYDAEWQNVIVPDEKYHQQLEDSKLALKLTWLFFFCLFSLLSVPLAIAVRARKEEGPNQYNTKAIVISAIGTVILVILVIFCFIFTPTLLGFSLQ